MNSKEIRCCVAEMLGTFAIVFFGCGAIATIGSGPVGHVGVNIVFGAVVTAMIYSLGHVSCAHFNPAVTIGFASVRRFPWRMVGPYIAAQTLGAVLACGGLFLFLPEEARAASFGATLATVGPVSAIGIEIVLTFFLMLVIVSVATDSRATSGFAGAAIGLWVMLAGLMAGPLTGSSMNPARSFGPALFAGELGPFWVYAVGPVLGACLGALTYEFLRASRVADRICPASCCGDC